MITLTNKEALLIRKALNKALWVERDDDELDNLLLTASNVIDKKIIAQDDDSVK